jgi:hypothetical protein
VIGAPSNQKPYVEHWSGDPAFVQPPQGDDETSARLRKEHADRIKRARETGSWSDLIVAGQKPTGFVSRSIRGDAMRWLHDKVGLSDPGKAIGDAMLLSLAFRCSLVSIENLGAEFTIEWEDHPGLGRIASSSVVAFLDGKDPGIVSELGNVALWRARLNPL